MAANGFGTWSKIDGSRRGNSWIGFMPANISTRWRSCVLGRGRGPRTGGTRVVVPGQCPDGPARWCGATFLCLAYLSQYDLDGLQRTLQPGSASQLLQSEVVLLGEQGAQVLAVVGDNNRFAPGNPSPVELGWERTRTHRPRKGVPKHRQSFAVPLTCSTLVEHVPPSFV